MRQILRWTLLRGFNYVSLGGVSSDDYASVKCSGVKLLAPLSLCGSFSISYLSTSVGGTEQGLESNGWNNILSPPNLPLCQLPSRQIIALRNTDRNF